MKMWRARAAGSMVTGTFDERPRVAVPMMICSEVMARGEPCVVQGRGLPWAGLTLGVSLSPSLRADNTTLATPACGRRPLAGVIPGHDLRSPTALYNAKVFENSKSEFLEFLEKAKVENRTRAKSRKSEFLKSTKSDAKLSSVRNFCVRRNRDSGTVALWKSPPHSPVVARKGTTPIGFPSSC